MAERRPTLTASARAGVRNLRSGRKKACGAVEQKKAAKQGKEIHPRAFGRVMTPIFRSEVPTPGRRIRSDRMRASGIRPRKP